MKKYFYVLSVFILSLVAGKTRAQEYTYTPADSVFQYEAVVDSYNTSEINETIQFHNNGTSTVTIIWVVQSNTNLGPSGWQPAGLCDNTTCYYDVDSNFFKPHTTDTIPPGDSCMFKAEFDASCISGDGLMQVAIHVEGDVNPATILTYKATAAANCTTAGIKELSDNNSIQIYPNPSNDFIYLESMPLNHPLNISLTDIEGRVVQTYTANGMEQMKLDISHLNAGLYLLKVFDQQSQQTYTGKVSKL